MDDRAIFIGMDLGTYKTSVACSNGRRHVDSSFVGWPKDLVARQLVGKDVIFGDDTIAHRLALDVIRPFERGALKYLDANEAGLDDDRIELHQKAAKLLAQHAIESVRGSADEAVYGVIGAPSRASIESKQLILEAVDDILAGAMIVPEPFAVAYGMGRLSGTLVIDIGAGTTDLCPMYGAFPTEEDQLTLAIGGDAIDQAFVTLLQKAHPTANLSVNMARQIKEKHGTVQPDGPIAIEMLPTNDGSQQLDITESLRTACTTIVEPILKGISELISRFDPEFRLPLLQNVLLAGGGSQLRGLDQVIEARLVKLGGGSVSRVYDSVFAGADGALKLAMNTPLEHWQQIAESDEREAAA